MHSLRIAAVSMNSELGKRSETLARMESYCDQAVTAGAELVVFPELVVHGHCTPNTWEIAEPIPGGESVAFLEDLARRKQVFLCAGFSEKENDIVYNTQAIFGPAGYIGDRKSTRLNSSH